MAARIVFGGAILGLGALWAWRKLTALQAELERMQGLRKEERQGRKRAEKRLEEVALAPQDTLCGFLHRQIGVLRTPFPTLQGTPRQGRLVPSTRGVIMLDDVLSAEALEGLDAFSHVWLVYVFHKNSNFFKHERAHREAAARAALVTEDPHKAQKKPKFRFTSKVSPPALKGKKIGVLATRSPHHPNAIGIIAVKLDGISIPKREVYVSGLDCVSGTPILDIKPYLPYSDAFVEASIPGWVANTKPAPVSFSPSALTQLREMVDQGASSMYSDYDSALAAISEVVSVNIKAKEYGVPRRILFDGLRITYSSGVGEEGAMVVSAVDADTTGLGEEAEAEEEA